MYTSHKDSNLIVIFYALSFIGVRYNNRTACSLMNRQMSNISVVIYTCIHIFRVGQGKPGFLRSACCSGRREISADLTDNAVPRPWHQCILKRSSCHTAFGIADIDSRYDPKYTEVRAVALNEL